LRAGSGPTRETIKLFLIHRALELRARRPEAFAGGYTPVTAGERCCAFLRGGPRPGAAASRGATASRGTAVSSGAAASRGTTASRAVLAATGVRSGIAGVELDLPASASGRWLDILSGAELELSGRVPIERISFGDWPVALLERLDQ
jgi:maltooligosyltrehalose synthase